MKRPASFSTSRRKGPRPHRSAGVALCVILGAFVAIAAACSNQGEGERCDSRNGNDDCKTDDGLICYPKVKLRGQPESDRCCPLDRSKATQPVCIEATDVVGGGDASIPTDTGPSTPVEAGTNDTGTTVDAADAADANDANDANDQ